jgi:hypothetical protein
VTQGGESSKLRFCADHESRDNCFFASAIVQWFYGIVLSAKCEMFARKTFLMGVLYLS